MNSNFMKVAFGTAMIATSAYAIDFSSPSHMLAQSSTQQLVTIIDGDLQPCPNTCAPGQFIWRDPETDNDCTCRYEMQNCDFLRMGRDQRNLHVR